MMGTWNRTRSLQYAGGGLVLVALALASLGLKLPAGAGGPGETAARGARPIRESGAKVVAANAQRIVGQIHARMPLRFEAWDESPHHNVAPGFSPAHSSRRKSRQSGAPVKFVSRGHGYTAFFTPTEVVLALQKSPGPTEKDKGHVAPGFSPARLGHSSAALKGGATSPNARKARDGGAATPGRGLRGAAVVRMKLVGANAAARIVGEDALPGRANYYIGNDPKKWRTNVPSYAKVRYEGVYPGIDLLYYGNERQLEYDFIVAPGADPKKIRLRFEGAEGLPAHVGAQHAAPIQMDAHGDLVLPTPAGEIRLRKPLIYQDTPAGRREIPGGYRHPEPFAVAQGKLREGSASAPHTHEVAFHVGDYDRSLPLIIDPVLTYSTYLGGMSHDLGLRIAVDAEGNIYALGVITRSRDFPTENPFQPEHGGGPNFYDASVTKFDASGSFLIYSTYLGGRDDDYGFGIAVDAEGNAYVSGGTYSPNFPTVKAFQPTLRGGGDAFLTKFDATGSVVFSTYLGGSGGEDSGGIAVDAEGNAYVTGGTNSPDFPTAGEPFQATLGGSTDAFVTKFDASGSFLIYSTYLGGNSQDAGQGIGVDAEGNATVTGPTRSLNFPTAKAFQATFGGGDFDAFVTKFDASGSALVFSTYLGSSGLDVGEGLAVHPKGNVYVTGETYAGDFPTVKAFQPIFAEGITDAFLTKFDPSGSVVYSTYLGGSGADVATGIAVDTEGNAYVTGTTTSSDFPIKDAVQPAPGGSNDVFVTQFDSSGAALVFSTYLGGSDLELNAGIAVDTEGNIYVTGETYSTNFPTQNPFQERNAGLADAFVSKISLGDSPSSSARNR